MRKYVVGLMFDDKMEKVVLILKKHGPKCVVGLWNGVGGHVETGEAPMHAITREYEEETGVRTETSDWKLFVELDGGPELMAPEFRVSFYWGRKEDAVNQVRTTTDEEVGIFDVNLALIAPVMPNLHWMIPFLKDPGTVNFIPALCCTHEDDE